MNNFEYQKLQFLDFESDQSTDSVCLEFFFLDQIFKEVFLFISSSLLPELNAGELEA